MLPVDMKRKLSTPYGNLFSLKCDIRSCLECKTHVGAVSIT